MTPHPPHDIVRAVRDELATPGRYQLHASAAPAQRSWLETAIRWIGDAFDKFEHALAARIHIGPTGAGILGNVLVFGSLAVIAVIAARFLVSMQIERGDYTAAPLVPARSALALSRAASEAASSGDFVRAIRLLFAAAVVMLDLRGVVEDEESATINDLRRELRARRGDAEAPFAAIARAYTAAAYAETRVDEDVWREASAAYARLAELAS